MRNKLLIILFLIVTIFIGGCKKYEENPLINLWPKNKRLTDGIDFSTVGFWVNGMDSLSMIQYRAYIGFHEIENQNKITGFIRGYWSLEDHKKYLRIDATPDAIYGVGPFLTENPIDWRITKLTDRELHLKTNYRNKEYIVHLHKVKI